MLENSKVTVLMPVYNGEKYLREAIESILLQTYTDFEFLIINDGSTDGSVEIIESYKDPRIRLVYNEKNLKLVATLNKGLELANGKYIARMDCDDISLPERLEKQVEFMDANSEVGICGTWLKTIGDGVGDIWKYPTEPGKIKCKLLFESVLAHPSVMMRREILKKHNLKYDMNYIHAEDYQLWQRASQLFNLANIAEVLLLYRIRGDGVSRSNKDLQSESVARIDREAISRLKICASAKELCLHRRLGLYDFEPSKDFVDETSAWLEKIRITNKRVDIYPSHFLDQLLSELWFMVCMRASGLGLWTWKTFCGSSLSNVAAFSFLQKSKFFVKCIIKHAMLSK